MISKFTVSQIHHCVTSGHWVLCNPPEYIPVIFCFEILPIMMHNCRMGSKFLWELNQNINSSWQKQCIWKCNGLIPVLHLAITWNDADLLIIGPSATNFSNILIKLPSVSFKKMHLKMPYMKWQPFCSGLNVLTHWGRVTHICVSKLTIIGSDNGLSPGRRQAIIWTNDGILLIRPLGTNFSEILSKIRIFSFKKMHLKTSSVKWRPFCLGFNVLNPPPPHDTAYSGVTESVPQANYVTKWRYQWALPVCK